MIHKVHTGAYGSFPERTACPANNAGYGPHEADSQWALVYLEDPAGRGYKLNPCKHCGAVFARRDAAE